MQNEPPSSTSWPTNPSAGTVIPATGGIRKIRWAIEGRGKRGGARIIYFFHNLDMPLFLLTAYAKNQREDLSQADYQSFHQLTQVLIKSYLHRRSKS